MRRNEETGSRVGRGRKESVLTTEQENRDEKLAYKMKLGKIGQVIRIDEGVPHGHLRQMVPEAVEETLNKILEADTDAQCGAK